jgi:hypothetical protein
MFIEPEHLSYGKVNELNGPALVRPIRKYGETFLLTGGDNPVAIALGGAEPGWFMRLEDGEHHEGLCIPDVSLEVDVTSAFSPTVVQRPCLSLIRHLAGVAIVGRIERGTYGRAPFIPWTGAAVPEGPGTVGFANWDVVIWLRDKRVVLHEHRSQTPTE